MGARVRGDRLGQGEQGWSCGLLRRGQRRRACSASSQAVSAPAGRASAQALARRRCSARPASSRRRSAPARSQRASRIAPSSRAGSVALGVQARPTHAGVVAGERGADDAAAVVHLLVQRSMFQAALLLTMNTAFAPWPSPESISIALMPKRAVAGDRDHLPLGEGSARDRARACRRRGSRRRRRQILEATPAPCGRRAGRRRRRW